MKIVQNVEEEELMEIQIVLLVAVAGIYTGVIVIEIANIITQVLF